MDFIHVVLSRGFKSNKGSHFYCEICPGGEQGGETFKTKQYLLRHFFQFKSNHWKAVVKIGKNSFKGNDELFKSFQKLENQAVVKYYLNQQAAIKAESGDCTDEEK